MKNDRARAGASFGIDTPDVRHDERIDSHQKRQEKPSPHPVDASSGHEQDQGEEKRLDQDEQNDAASITRLRLPSRALCIRGIDH
jgi:hypothetical protein